MLAGWWCDKPAGRHITLQGIIEILSRCTVLVSLVLMASFFLCAGWWCAKPAGRHITLQSQHWSTPQDAQSYAVAFNATLAFQLMTCPFTCPMGCLSMTLCACRMGVQQASRQAYHPPRHHGTLCSSGAPGNCPLPSQRLHRNRYCSFLLSCDLEAFWCVTPYLAGSSACHLPRQRLHQNSIAA